MTRKLTRQTDEELAALALYASEAICHPDPNFWLEFKKLAYPGAVLNLVEELQERRKAENAEPVYQYRIRNDYNGQVTEWQTIRRDQVDFVMKAQPLNAEFQIIVAPQPISDAERAELQECRKVVMDSAVYQLWSAGIGQWVECDKARYDAHESLPAQRRVLYTAAPAMDSKPVAYPAQQDAAQGWKIDPEFINKVQESIGYDEECECWEGTPSMEMVEAVLLAASRLTSGNE